jgi:hypothetical protein
MYRNLAFRHIRVLILAQRRAELIERSTLP